MVAEPLETFKRSTEPTCLGMFIIAINVPCPMHRSWIGCAAWKWAWGESPAKPHGTASVSERPGRPAAPLYYYPSNSSRAATVLCGAGWQPAADCGSPLGAARRAELACTRDDLAPGSPEYPPRLGCGSAALRGRSSTCGPAQGAPAIGPMPALYKRQQAGYKPAAG